MTVATIAPSVGPERGYAGGIMPAPGANVTGSRYIIEGLEQTPELAFPASAAIFDRMRRSDGPLAGTMRAFTLPIRATTWSLQGADVRPEVLTFLNAELGLGEENGRRRRRRAGIDFAEHLRDALLMLPFGFAPFEQVYEVGPPNPDAPVGDLTEVAHLRKLAFRSPRSLHAIEVARDGGLTAIVQSAPYGATPANMPSLDLARGGIPIPVSNLVMYVNDREGAEWTGNSVLRAAYKHWLIKDALLRLGPMVCERNGMGVPVVTYPKGGSEAKALAMARAFRAGSDAGTALEEGYVLNLIGTTGSTRDELPLVKYHDEAAGRSLLAMFLDLGHDNGARSLGDTFVDYFLLALGAIVKNVEETFTEHVIRDLVELNYGPDEAYPMLKATPITAEGNPTAAALGELAKYGLLTPDDSLEGDLRRRYSLPPIDEATRRTPAAKPAPGAGPAGAPGDVAIGPLEEDPAGDPPAPGAVTVPAHTRRAPTAASADELTQRAADLLERTLALRAG